VALEHATVEPVERHEVAVRADSCEAAEQFVWVMAPELLRDLVGEELQSSVLWASQVALLLAVEL
jgi:hypothetical protein